MPYNKDFDSDKSIRSLWNKLKGRYLPKGIPVCQEWLDSFQLFKRDVGGRPSKYHLLILKDKVLGYIPGNTEWFLPANNTFLLQDFEIEGVTKTIYEWCEVYKIKSKTVYTRYIEGLVDIIKCLSLPSYSKPHERSDKLSEEERRTSAKATRNKMEGEGRRKRSASGRKEEDKEERRQWRINNPKRPPPEKIKKPKDTRTKNEKLRDWHKNNPQKQKEYDAKYLELYGREHYREKKRTENYKFQARKRYGERYNQDPKYRVMRRCRARFNGAIKSAKAGKFFRTIEVVGASWDRLTKYLEKKFTEGMSWDLYENKKLHIDHIMPVNMFNLDYPMEQKRCFHFTNLQPMWGSENQSKNCYYDGTDAHINIDSELDTDGNIIYNLDYYI